MNKIEILIVLGILEQYKYNTKGLHWGAEGMTSLSTHKICDDIYSDINGFQDIIAEYYQGATLDNITQKHLKPILDDNIYDNITDLLISLSEYMVTLHGEIKDGIWIGLKSEIESFIAKLVKFRYLSCLK